MKMLRGLCLLVLAFGQDFLITDSQVDTPVSQTSVILKAAKFTMPDYSKQSTWGGKCNSGTQQSPINLQGSVGIKQKVVKSVVKKKVIQKVTNQGFAIVKSDGDLKYYNISKANYYTISSNITTAPALPIDLKSGTKVDNSNTQIPSDLMVKQILFHAPSEHKIRGKQYDLEMQVIFIDEDSTSVQTIYKAALSVLFKTGSQNQQLENLHKNASVNLLKLVGAETIYVYKSGKKTTKENALGKVYYYKGSLTYPDCTESIQWIVNGDVQSASATQIKRFTDLWKNVKNEGLAKGNYRKVQKLNARRVYSYGVSRGNILGFMAFIFALLL